MPIATIVTDPSELQQILQLQKKNLIPELSSDEMKAEGFLTLMHTPEMLQQMHALAPSIIIKEDDQVVAFALTMLRECRQVVPPLEPMFAVLDTVQWGQRPLNDSRFYVMGQICVDKEWRAQGLFDKLYHHHRTRYQSQFDCIVTEISTRNYRSLRAHERVGFKTIHIHRDELDEWAIVVWDWQ